MLRFLANNNQLTGCFPASLSALCGGGRTINFSVNPGLPRNGDFTAFCASGFGSDGFVAQAEASQPAVCTGSAVSLSANGGSGYSYSWLVPAGAKLSSTTTQNVSATLTTAGVQTFTIVISSGSSCSSTATLSVTGDAAPTVGLTNNGPLSCTLSNVTLTATDADSFTFTNSDGTVLAGSGNIRTVTTPGTYSVTVANASGCVSTTSTTVTSNTATVIVTNPAITTATQGVTFSQSFTASDGTAPYTYTLASGTLPQGLSLSTSGVLSGTPTESGNFSMTVQATDANGCVGVSNTYTLTVINATPIITGLVASPNAVCVGSPVTFTATVGNVTGSYAYTLTNGTSTSLTGNTTSTALSQNLTASGSGMQNFTLTVSSNGQTTAAATGLTVNPLPVAGLTNNGPLTCAQTSVTLTATGGSSYTFTNSNGTVLAGSGNTRTVSSPGTYSVTGANASGCVSTTSTTVISNTATVTVSNPATTTATAGTAFSQTFTASGGATPYSFSLVSGSLPAGLSLSAAGVLSGTPTQSSSFPLTIRATDANGCSGVSATYTLTIVNSTPTIADFAASPNAVCVGNPITFTATVGNVTGSYA
ncbi:hypothetical protein GK091_29280, partial [Spirosoma agri]